MLDRSHLGEREDILRGNRQVVIDVRDTYDDAKRKREVFHGKQVQKEIPLEIQWPRFVHYLGKTNAEIYYSNKMLNGGKWELYKHIVEGPQFLFVNAEATRLLNDYSAEVEFREAGRKLRGPEGGKVPTAFYTRSYEITGPMPQHLSQLAANKGVQWVAPNGRFFEARIPNSMTAAAVHPKTGEAILLVYSNEGVHFLITGPKLDITKDGIVG